MYIESTEANLFIIRAAPSSFCFVPAVSRLTTRAAVATASAFLDCRANDVVAV